MNLIEIGARIKAYRKSMGISQERLAEMINVSPHYIYEIERGLKSMSLEIFVRLSTTLNLSTDYILFGNQTSNTVSLSEQLDEMDAEQRKRVESAFTALLPYIK